MEITSELETELHDEQFIKLPQILRVLSLGASYELKLPQLGDDFIAGIHNGVFVVLPIEGVTQLCGPNLPARTEQSLEEFLLRQRTPIRLRLITDTEQNTCWLLNIQDRWLRVSISTGVSWVPMSAIRSMEIVAVDNSKQ